MSENVEDQIKAADAAQPEPRPSDLVKDELPGEVPHTWANATTAEREAVIREAMKEVVDPELMVNVVDLGLLYGIDIDDDMHITLDMTLTSPACPLTDEIEFAAKHALSQIASGVTINWVWLPPWTMEMITEDGREQLRSIGFMI